MLNLAISAPQRGITRQSASINPPSNKIGQENSCFLVRLKSVSSAIVGHVSQYTVFLVSRVLDELLYGYEKAPPHIDTEPFTHVAEIFTDQCEC